jgi:hypothetical protein
MYPRRDFLKRRCLERLRLPIGRDVPQHHIDRSERRLLFYNVPPMTSAAIGETKIAEAFRHRPTKFDLGAPLLDGLGDRSDHYEPGYRPVRQRLGYKVSTVVNLSRFQFQERLTAAPLELSRISAGPREAKVTQNHLLKSYVFGSPRRDLGG